MVSSGLVALHLAYTTFYYGIFIHLVYVYELWRNRQTIVNAHCLSFSFGNVSVVVNKIAKNICMTKHVRKKKHDFRKKSKQKIEKKKQTFFVPYTNHHYDNAFWPSLQNFSNNFFVELIFFFASHFFDFFCIFWWVWILTFSPFIA